MYTVTGDPVKNEHVLEHLAGYKGSTPVRVGNDAADQFQLDVYGTLIDAIYFSVQHGMEFRAREKSLVKKLVKKIADRWQTKDSGIWEMRSADQHFTYSKVMAWVGVNRARFLAEKMDITDRSLQGWKNLEQNILDWIKKQCFTADGKKILQHPETNHQDATNFLFPLVKFLDKHNENVPTILENTWQELACPNTDSLLYRYKTADGLAGGEGAFQLCSFWRISAWAILNKTEKARDIFADLSTYIADNGLLSEEIDPESGKYRGNFPQAFSHMGHIMAAYYIDKYQNRPDS
jgi:GH15 family glucan-1,4-alpha-glucosidase